MEFKDLIKTRRLEIGKTLEEIGNIVGVSKTTVQRWESGDIANLRRDKIAQLAIALEVSPAYLMGWEDEKEKAPQGEEPPRSELEKKIIDGAAMLNDDNRQTVLDLVESLMSRQGQ